MDAFRSALDQVLRWEGGYVDHPQDPGAATNYGITQATYDAWRRQHGLATLPVLQISPEDVRAIYHDHYWLKAGCDQLDPPALALVVFDAAVNSGVGNALRWLSQSRDWREYQALRLEFLASLNTWPTFGRGWARRVADLTRAAARLDASTGPPDRELLGRHEVVVDNSPSVGKAVQQFSAALAGRPVVLGPHVVTRTPRPDGSHKLDLRATSE